MRQIALICLLALAVAGCGGKKEQANNGTPKNSGQSIPPNTKLVKLELPGMT